MKGKNINFRLAETSDAEFIFNLRKEKGQHLSKVESLEAQVEWFSEYKLREGLEEFYFIIERKGESIGTVRLYDFKDDSFSWGSWIIKDGVPLMTAIESALMVYDFAFECGFKKSHFCVRKENKKVIKFHQDFRASVVGETEKDFLFSFSKEDYQKTRNRFKSLVFPVPVFIPEMKVFEY